MTIEYAPPRHYTPDTIAERIARLCADAVEAARWARLRLEHRRGIR